MSYASYVGRVGALAVALGIGTAVATVTPEVAWATPGADSSTSDGASSGSPRSTGTNSANDSTGTTQAGSSVSTRPSAAVPGNATAGRHSATRKPGGDTLPRVSVNGQ